MMNHELIREALRDKIGSLQGILVREMNSSCVPNIYSQGQISRSPYEAWRSICQVKPGPVEDEIEQYIMYVQNQINQIRAFKVELKELHDTIK